MAKIYLSSTYSDLKKCRDEVCRALRRLRHQVIAMEDYVATGQHPPLEECLSDVAECDFYVGIFAWRYGYIPNDGNPQHRSITELEYRKACELNKPRFIFLLSEEADWSRPLMDSVTGDGERGQRIDALRQELSEKQMVSFFSTATDLAGLVSAAISRWCEKASSTPEKKVEPDQGVLLGQWELPEPQSIEVIKQNLEFAEKLYKEGQLPVGQLQPFNTLKQQAGSIAIQIKNLEHQAESLIRETMQILKAEIEKIRSEANEAIERTIEGQAENTTNLECRLLEYEILEQLSEGLQAGKEAAEWLDKHRERLAKRAVEASLSNFPSLRETLLDEAVDDFQWDVQQYLKRISFCLTWGRSGLLDEPDGLETVPIEVYVSAFTFIKDRIQEKKPESLSSIAVEQLVGYLDYLIRNLL